MKYLIDDPFSKGHSSEVSCNSLVLRLSVARPCVACG